MARLVLVLLVKVSQTEVVAGHHWLILAPTLGPADLVVILVQVSFTHFRWQAFVDRLETCMVPQRLCSSYRCMCFRGTTLAVGPAGN